MPVEIDISACLAANPGRGRLSRARFEALLGALEPGRQRLAAGEGREAAVLLELANRDDDLEEIAEAAERLAAFTDVAIVGTGGSSLGARTLTALAGGKGRPRLHFLENLGPWTLQRFLETTPPERLGLVMVSKSGATMESLALSTILLKHLEEGGVEPAERALAITQTGDSPLGRLAKAYRLPWLAHDPDVGGRFSVLSNVGLLPAALAGLSPKDLRAGAAALTKLALEAVDSPPAQGAALAFGLAQDEGASQSVLMPYVQRLDLFALWYRQLWAESLGKDGKGTTPIRALGTVDQHSQLQLYLDGPRDKAFTLIWRRTAGEGPGLACAQSGAAGLETLAGHRLGDLLEAEARATADSLIETGRPVRQIRLERLDAWVLGYLLQHFMLETLFAAHLFDVSPFGQPAVERGKQLARDYLAAMRERE